MMKKRISTGHAYTCWMFGAIFGSARQITVYRGRFGVPQFASCSGVLLALKILSYGKFFVAFSIDFLSDSLLTE